MALEDLTGTKYIDDLVSTNPAAGDNVSEGDDHIRGIKNVLKTTFPSIDGAVTATQAELNLLDGVTSTTAELNILDGVTSTAAELNILDGVTATAAELNYVDGVTSNVQTQLDAKLALAGGTMTGDLLLGANKVGADAGDYIKFTADTQTDFYVNGGNEMRLEADGDLHVDGDVIAFSSTISDATLKYDINPVEFALDKINQLKGVTYKYLNGDKESAGLLAQDVEKVLPSAVTERKVPLHTGDDKKYKTLNYDSLHAILIEAIKELTAKVEKLERK